VVLETQAKPPIAVQQGSARLCGMFEEEKPYLVDRWR
jgi:hypothetical protein